MPRPKVIEPDPYLGVPARSMHPIEFGPCPRWSPACTGQGIARVDPVKVYAADSSAPFATEVMCGACWSRRDAEADFTRKDS